MSQRNRTTVAYLLRQLNELRRQIDEAIQSVDPTAPDHSFTCKGCGHSDWEHTNFAGGCIATKPCGCVGMDTVKPECDHIEGGEIPHTTEGINVWLRFTYCPLCGEKL